MSKHNIVVVCSTIQSIIFCICIFVIIFTFKEKIDGWLELEGLNACVGLLVVGFYFCVIDFNDEDEE